MTNHRQDEGYGRVVRAGLTALVAIGLNFWVAAGPGKTMRDIVALGMGSALTAVLIAVFLDRIGERKVARLTSQHSRNLREAAMRANTGTWEGDGADEVLTVRYEPETGRWYMQGFIGEKRGRILHESYCALDWIAQRVDALELGGHLVPWADDATSAIRYRLGLPSWPGGPPEGPPAGEETQVIGQLRPIGVPVWTGDETEVLRRG